MEGFRGSQGLCRSPDALFGGKGDVEGVDRLENIDVFVLCHLISYINAHNNIKIASPLCSK